MTNLAEARRQAEEALARDCHPYTECMSEDEPCIDKMRSALRDLLAATADPADAELSEAKATLANAYRELADEFAMERIWRKVVLRDGEAIQQPKGCCDALHRIARLAPCFCPCHGAPSPRLPQEDEVEGAE